MEKVKTGFIHAWTWVKETCITGFCLIVGFIMVVTRKDLRRVFMDYWHDECTVDEYLDELGRIAKELVE